MSLTRRLATSFIIILSLSLSSILIHLWANDIRREKVALLQDVIRTQSLVNDFSQRLEGMHKKILVVEALREADRSNVLTDEEQADIVRRIEVLREDQDRLSEKLTRFLEEGNRVDIGAEELLQAWAVFISGNSENPHKAGSPVPYGMVRDRLTKNEWLLLAKSDTINHELKEVVSTTNKIALGVFLFSLIVTFILAYHVIRYTRRSIRSLQRGTAEWGAGNLAYQIPRIGNDELGQLAQSFNAMAGNLRVAMEEVREASRQADAANQAKSSFLANMSHELRTPMNAIIGYSEMLMEEAEEDGSLPAAELRPDLEKILAAGKHLLDLINDVLDISKIESGKMSLYIETTNLHEMLESVQTTVKPLLEKNNNRLHFDYNIDVDLIRTDVTRFRQIVLNLLSNAAKFTRDGDITLQAGRKTMDGQDVLEIAVADTGIGMSEEQLARIFDAFIQADLSTTREYGGSGLGLTISKKFAELLHGDILVESRLGEGSRFTLVLPWLQQDDESVPDAGHVISVDEGEQTGTVLVIDDDPAALDLTRRILSRENYRVVTASSGQDGLDKARASRPDVIILDVMMPGMDGWQALKSFREMPETARTPVVMQSLLHEEDLAMLLGADEYLVKPIDREKLSRAVSGLLPKDDTGNLLLIESDGALAPLIQEQSPPDVWEVFRPEDLDKAEALLETVPFQLIVIGNHDDAEALGRFMEKVQSAEVKQSIPLLLIQSEAEDHAPIDQLKHYLRSHAEANREAVAG